jgi:hypothetical protein
VTARDDLYDVAADDNVCDCHPEGAAEINARIDAYRDEVLADDAEQKRATLAELVAYRLQVIGEITSMLRNLPHYDRDHPAALRIARRIEEWASQ